MTYDNTNRGQIWKNEKKTTESHPDFTGTLNVNGVEFYVSAWKRKEAAASASTHLRATMRYCSDHGRLEASLIYEKHFVEHEIVGETKLSWVTDKGGFKISKRDGTCPKAMQFAGRGFFTFEEMQDDIWQHVHRYKIERLLVQASPDKLRKVAEIIGYQP